jgi:hypothetical protein
MPANNTQKKLQRKNQTINTLLKNLNLQGKKEEGKYGLL